MDKKTRPILTAEDIFHSICAYIKEREDFPTPQLKLTGLQLCMCAVGYSGNVPEIRKIKTG